MKHIQKALFDALTARRTPPHVTSGFRAKRHNDHLCPETKERVELVLSRMERHFTLAYDVQGPRDGGADVLVRLSSGDETSYIGLQIKSSVEAKKGVYKLLKAQWADAVSQYKSLLDYYVLLCWDQATQADQVRTVEQALHGLPNVHVIEPGHVWSFLYDLTSSEIEAIVRIQATDDDPLIQEARASILLNSPEETAMLCSAVATAAWQGEDRVTLASLRGSSVVRRAYDLSQ